MNLLDANSTPEEINAFQDEINALSETLRRNHIRPERIHGWCGAEGERMPLYLRMNMHYLHLLACEGLIGSGAKESPRRRGRRGQTR